jgi:hypothetical protein
MTAKQWNVTVAMLLAGLLAGGLATGCAVEDEEAEVASTTAALGAGDDVGTSTLTWTYLGTESCFDFFLRTCNDSLPNNQFPGMGAGLPCPQSGLFGNKRLPGNTYFEQYICG